MITDLKPFLPKSEEEILKFWEEKRIFERLRQKNQDKKRWSFLDGPITANNPMGVHHAWGRTYKDLFQRYKAMRGFDQCFQNGFDCQGLWVEVEVEKELGFKSKKDIEEYGIENFVNKCKERVLKYSKIQTKQSIRLGQWMDWENSYYTMSDENNYAIWYFLKKCYENSWIYKGYESIPWCPRCQTGISQHEILTEDYKELTHESIILKFPIVGRNKEFLLVWTTTPWTLLANIAIAVDKDFEYSLVQQSDEKYWVLKILATKIFKNKEYRILKNVKGKELIGLKYETAFDDLPKINAMLRKNSNNYHIVIPTDSTIMPITIDEGTGLVHTAVSAGTEDYRLGKKLGLPMLPIIGDNADYLEGFGEFSNKNAKNNPRIILDYLEDKEKKEKKWVFAIFSYTHRYPVCWRCKTELVWKVADEWYIKMDELREKMIRVAQKIRWLPDFGLKQELDWLKNMEDWLISKKRYWGLALPIYECECGNIEVIGSKEELRKKAVEGWQKFEGHSPHRPWVDMVKIKCSKCGNKISRIKDVGNPWLDAGIVPFSTMKYFTDKKYWQKWFPADFICESFPGQFKNWFYSLIAMSTVLENREPFKNVLGYASLRDEKGEEMHKSKGNAIWFDEAAKRVGADSMRWLYSKSNPFENLKFGYHNISEAKRNLMLFVNVVNFYLLYSKIDQFKAPKKLSTSGNILDRWIISRLNETILKVTRSLDEYHPQRAAKKIEDLILDLSLWYLRRSRKRRNIEFYQTLYQVILDVTRLLAPFLPFLSEIIYQKIRNKNDFTSIHLHDWPKADPKKIETSLNEKMQICRDIASIVFALRDEANIKVRQPLSELGLWGEGSKIKNDQELIKILADEINVNKIVFQKMKKKKHWLIREEKKIGIALNCEITPELKEAGIVRDIIRIIQEGRKLANLNPDNQVKIFIDCKNSKVIRIIMKYKKTISQNVSAINIEFKRNGFDFEKEFSLDGDKIWIGIKK